MKNYIFFMNVLILSFSDCVFARESGEVRGGGGGDIVFCKGKPFALDYIRTQNFESDEITNKNGQLINFSTAHRLNKLRTKFKNNEITARRNFCYSSLRLIQKRFLEISKSINEKNQKSKELRAGFKSFAEELKDYIELISEAGKKKKTSEQNFRIEDNKLLGKMTKKWTYLNEKEWKSKWNILDIKDEQLYKELPVECSQPQQTIIKTWEASDITEGSGEGKWHWTHIYEGNKVLLSKIEDGRLSDDYSDHQCSFMHMHEYFRQFISDASLIAFYVKYIHSEAFFEDNLSAKVLLDYNKNKEADFFNTSGISEVQFLNPFSVLGSNSSEKIFPVKSLIESGYSPDDIFNKTSKVAKLSTIDSPQISTSRMLSLDILYKYLISGPTHLIDDSQRIIFKMGDKFSYNDRIYSVLGFTVSKQIVLWSGDRFNDGSRGFDFKNIDLIFGSIDQIKELTKF